MILVKENYLLDLVHDAFADGWRTSFYRKGMDECFKEYLPKLTYDFDALHLNKKQKVKIKNAIEKHLEFMEAMEKLKKGIIDEEDKGDCPF